MDQYDIIVIGAGIVGTSTAWQLKKLHPDASVLLLDKEHSAATHQTGHNSGVIHAGVYYQPGSLKAEFCKQGAAQTIDFCQEHNLPFEQCGKLLVATDEIEHQRMLSLQERCSLNRIKCERITAAELTTLEPDIRGEGALFIPATSITDFKRVTEKMAELFVEAGGIIQLNSEVKAIREKPERLEIDLAHQRAASSFLITCGGLHADRLASMTGVDLDFRIIPFRGEYYRLRPQHELNINHLIYPIPDPKLPFLGVHLTRMIDGSITVGPNAVLGWKREGYGRINFNLRDTAEMIAFPGFWKVINAHLGSGLEEMRDSLYQPGYLRRVQKYCPRLQRTDLLPYPPGIRAQAVTADGQLVHDFLFTSTPRSLHVCNAPSPAATSAMPIGRYICDKATEVFSF